jgi:hypothetical protein
MEKENLESKNIGEIHNYIIKNDNNKIMNALVMNKYESEIRTILRVESVGSN